MVPLQQREPHEKSKYREMEASSERVKTDWRALEAKS
jgi:hypothetical protein